MNYTDKDKILILSATYGDGHKQVANAISEAVDFSLPNVEPIILDIMQWLHPYLYPVSNYCYKKVINKFPQLYSFLYRKTHARSTFSAKLNALFSRGMSSLLEILQTMNPKVVVSTYPLAAGIMSKLKEQGFIDVPVVTIITDYTDHSYWLHPYTDQYVVGSNQVKEKLISLGIDPHKIKCTGIPIRQKFIQTEPRDVLAEKYGLIPNQFTVLVMGGGEGFIGKGISTFRAFEKLASPIQLIIICGRNRKLQKQLEAVVRNSKHKVLILGFSEDINELMAVSDLMVSKSGGVTTTEAMAMELPLLIYRPLPGQEEDNAKFLVKSGMAILAKNEEDIISNIQNMLSNSIPLLLMKFKARINQTKTSSFDALDVILREANSRVTQKSVSV
ncbi:glycosyltransferase [Neobacillus sp. PS2-9]|uniref:MGDG synthase family glycosyltransferase n=1 Tax=Neobacillus sp. PS2-9 TaxID=3070676 RepID=UPI0027E09CD1|nr:glycosyltransferase [Neobacillus sp. PS2-9]WML56628.1 glycosyltransferase [Neobacillus sp. PS2-9]